MKRKNQKILVLGTANAQLDLINFCKKRGYKVYSCSNRKVGRGVEQSDEFAEIDITDIPTITEYVEKNKIDIIYTIGSDLALQTVAVTSEKLNLPTFFNRETALVCSHKSRLREKLKAYPEYSVIHREVNRTDKLHDWNCYPAIVKPNDNQGQRGISEISSSNQLVEAFYKAIGYSQSKSVIIEEFINGFEISINLYVVDSKVKFQFMSERLSFDNYPGGIIKGHRYPIRKKIDLDEIVRMVKILIMELGIKNGPVYMQVMITDKGMPKVIEVTPRLDGCHLWRMIYELKGINILEILLNHLIIGTVDDDSFELKTNINGKEAMLDFFTNKPSSKFSRKNHHPSDKAIFTEWFYQNGEQVRKINGYQEKVGYQLIL